MNIPEVRQLEELLLQVEAEGATAELVAQIETLLLDRLDLQEHYTRWMSLHVWLESEFGLAGTDFAPLILPLPTKSVREQRPLATPSSNHRVESLSQRLKRRLKYASWENVRNSHLVLASLLGLLGLGLLSYFGSRQFIDRLAEVRFDSRERVPSSVQTLDHQATSTEDTHPPLVLAGWPNLRLASFGANQLSALQPSPGPVWLEHFNQQPAAGYMIQVPSGCELDLAVDGTSEGENQLAVIEMDLDGNPAGQTVSFSNNSDRSQATQVPRFGRLGTWSYYNRGQATKLFLLAGIHRLYQSTSDDSWHVSDFTITLHSEEITHIGWDDSGVRIDSKWDAGEYVPDRDYNDITASIQVRAANRRIKSSEQKRGFRAVPPPLSSGTYQGPLDARFPLILRPYETVILRCTSDAADENWLGVLDEDGQVLWSANNLAAKSPLIGTFALENLSAADKTFYLASRHRESRKNPNAPWISSEYQVLMQNDDYSAVGFEDAVQDGDWNDVRVDLHWISR